MKPEKIFDDLRQHKENGGALSILESAALDAWESGNRHDASYFLSCQDLVSSGGFADAP